MSWVTLISAAIPIIRTLVKSAEAVIPEPKSGERRMEWVLSALTPLAGKMLGADPSRDVLRGAVEAVLAGLKPTDGHCSHCCPKRVSDEK